MKHGLSSKDCKGRNKDATRKKGSSSSLVGIIPDSVVEL
jgi:hypothetical protein